ncbi:MAG: hypothetical protein J6C53_03225 [Clostridia bacterium]|nr:hypothetical protein [Clostridia bacterium]
MKKKLLSIVALIFCVAMIFTGCATVGAIKDKEGNPIYFDDAKSFGGHIAEVGDYVYYANSYVATTDEGFVYDEASNIAYLSRIENKNVYTFDEDVLPENYPNTTPNEAEKVKGGKLVGYENQQMYALGSYLYFTSANVHKTSDMENDYTQVSIFRIKFDGSSFQEIATFAHGDKGQIELTKGSDGQYYFVAVVPNGEKFDIKSVKVGDSFGKVKTLAEEVNTAVIADENSSIKNVIYTVDTEKDMTTIAVKAVDFATGDDETLDEGVAGSETKLMGRVGDYVFYSYKNPADNVNQVYWQTINAQNNNFSPVNRFYNATTIKNLQPAYQGYIFQTEGGALVYKTLDGVEERLFAEDEYTDVMFVDGQFVYTSTDTAITRVSLEDYAKEKIVKDVKMISGMGGITEDYIYFYAQLGELTADENDEEEEEAEADENYYMYRADKNGNLQIIGKTAKK